MKNKELFDKTVSILVNAYQNDTLNPGDYCGCAVGNLIAASCGYKTIRQIEDVKWIDKDGNLVPGYLWYSALITRGAPITKNVRDQISLTGYSIREIIEIEKAFERVERFIGRDNRMFAGLMAVVDTLMLIHEATPQEAESAKLQFVRA